MLGLDNRLEVHMLAYSCIGMVVGQANLTELQLDKILSQSPNDIPGVKPFRQSMKLSYKCKNLQSVMSYIGHTIPKEKVDQINEWKSMRDDFAHGAPGTTKHGKTRIRIMNRGKVYDVQACINNFGKLSDAVNQTLSECAKILNIVT